MASIGTRALARLAVAVFACVAACSANDAPSVASPDSTPPPAAAALESSPLARTVPFDLDAVIARVRFGYRLEDARYVADHASYEVAVDGGRVAFTPVAGARGNSCRGRRCRPSTRSASLETVFVGRGPAAAITEKAPSATIADDGHLELHRGSALETLRNDANGVEQSWTVPSMPPGAGPLQVRVRVTGLPYAGATPRGLHFADAGGLGMRYGHGTWIGADGARTSVPATWDGGAIVLSVPASVVASTAFPARLDPTVQAEQGIDDPVTGPADGDQVEPSVAFDGTNYLVVWGTTLLRATRVSPAGTVLDPAGIIIKSQHGGDPRPSVASAGTGFLVTWQALDDQGKREIRGARISAAGAVQDPMGFVVASDAFADDDQPAVAAAGSGYLVVYREWDLILGRRVSTGGQVLDASPLAISDPNAFDESAEPRIASSTNQYLVVWQERPGSEWMARGTFVSTAGVVDDPAGIDISPSAEDQTHPGVAFNGTNWLVVWQSQPQNGSPSVRGARLSAAHTVLDASGIAVSGGAYDKQRPTVAASGTEWFVVWDRVRTQIVNGTPTDFFQLFGTKVTAAGGVPAPNGNLLSTEADHLQEAAIVGSPTGYLLAWEQAYEQNATSRVHGTRLDPNGALLDAVELSLATGANGELSPAVASNGAGYLVVWSDRRAGAADTDIWGALVAPDGQTVTPQGIGIALHPDRQSSPKVASDGDGFLVLWSNDAADALVLVEGTIVAADGSVPNPAGFAIAPAGFNPEVASNGTDYLVVWDEYGGNTDEDILGARVAADGTVLDPTGFGISKEPWLDWQPTVASNGIDWLVAWEEDALTKSDVVAARVAADGTVLDPLGVDLALGDPYQTGPAAASNGTDYYVAWEETDLGPTTIRGTNVDPAGTVLVPNGKLLCTSPEPQGRPAVGSDGTGYIALWKDYRSGHAEIYGTWITPQGGVLAQQGVAIDADNGILPDEAASIAAAVEGSWLVVYGEYDPNPPIAAPRVHGRLIAGTVDALANGAPCMSAGLCGSGFCVDGVCCDDACGNGDLADCQACSVLKGGTVNGTCGPIARGHVCRQSSDACDLAETCDGASTTCPLDMGSPNGDACDDDDPCTSADQCTAGTCKGTPLDCTPDTDCRIGECVDGACAFVDADDGIECAMAPGDPASGLCKDGVCVPPSDYTTTAGGHPQQGPLVGAGGGGCGCRIGEADERGTLAGIAIALGAIAARRARRRR